MRIRRVPLRGWLLLILCFAACGAVFSFTYLQHLESISEDHGFHRFRRARDWARRRHRHGSSSGGGDSSNTLPLAAASQLANSSRLSANAADWLHDRNARHAAAAAGSDNSSGSRNSGSDDITAAEHVKLAAGGFHKRQRQHVRNAEEAKRARHKQREAAAADSGQQRQQETADAARQRVQGQQGSRGPAADRQGVSEGDGGRDSSGKAVDASRSSRSGGGGRHGSSGSMSADRGADAGSLGSGGDSSAGSSRGRPQGQRGDPARCGRGIQHGQENRFCCSGAAFTCGSFNTTAGDSIDGSSSSSDVNGSRKQIDCARVNDNYPDCTDGSDEPGTSAASHLGARFTCHDGKTIPTSFVDDGVCDCCDGADERPPTPRCRHRCAALVDEELAYI